MRKAKKHGSSPAILNVLDDVFHKKNCLSIVPSLCNVGLKKGVQI